MGLFSNGGILCRTVFCLVILECTPITIRRQAAWYYYYPGGTGTGTGTFNLYFRKLKMLVQSQVAIYGVMSHDISVRYRR